MSAHLDNLLPLAAPRYGNSEPSAKAGLLADFLLQVERGNADALMPVPAWKEGSQQPLLLVFPDLFSTPNGIGDGFVRDLLKALAAALKSPDREVRYLAGALVSKMGREYAETHAADLEVQ